MVNKCWLPTPAGKGSCLCEELPTHRTIRQQQKERAHCQKGTLEKVRNVGRFKGTRFCDCFRKTGEGSKHMLGVAMTCLWGDRKKRKEEREKKKRERERESIRLEITHPLDPRTECSHCVPWPTSSVPLCCSGNWGGDGGGGPKMI